MLRHTFWHVMTHLIHVVTHFYHVTTHLLHTVTHYLHNVAHPKALRALTGAACSDRGSVWNYMDPPRIYERIILLDLVNVYVDNSLKEFTLVRNLEHLRECQISDMNRHG